jgi:SAM-dependent methyltransferase
VLAVQNGDPQDLRAFYDDAYSCAGEAAERYGRWRALSAIGKADHVVELCRRARVRPAGTLEVGCGDGALLAELARRRFGGRLSGLEITPAAVEIAARQAAIDDVALYDGASIPADDATYDLGILSHVLEHVADPAALLAEVARVSRGVFVEVPLEANLSARRASKRRIADEVGHLQRLSRARTRAIVESAGLRIEGELEDALPLRVHAFWAATRPARARAATKWALRASAHRLAPSLARRAFTVHYACLCRAT